MTTPPETLSPELQRFQDRHYRIAALVMLILSFLVIVGIEGMGMLYIIPRFEKIFKDFHTTLPDATILLIQFSHFFLIYWYASIPLILGGYTALFLLALNGNRKWLKLVLSLSIALIALAVLSIPFLTVALFLPLVSLIQHVKS